MHKLNDFSLRCWVRSQNFRQRLQEERGAETVQVIMIMGIMAIIIAAIFLGDNGLQKKIEALGTRVKTWVSGLNSDDPATP